MPFKTNPGCGCCEGVPCEITCTYIDEDTEITRDADSVRITFSASHTGGGCSSDLCDTMFSSLVLDKHSESGEDCLYFSYCESFADSCTYDGTTFDNVSLWVIAEWDGSVLSVTYYAIFWDDGDTDFCTLSQSDQLANYTSYVRAVLVPTFYLHPTTEGGCSLYAAVTSDPANPYGVSGGCCELPLDDSLPCHVLEMPVACWKAGVWGLTLLCDADCCCSAGGTGSVPEIDEFCTFGFDDIVSMSGEFLDSYP